MNKIKRIPTLIGFIVLLAGIASGVVLINLGSKLLLRASPEVTPKQVKITNITEGTFSVSWITDAKATGFVKYGTDKELSFTATDDRDQFSGRTDSFFTHHITVRNLKAATAYLFKLGSEDKIFDNNGQEYQVTTAPAIQTPAPANDVAYGTVVNPDSSPAEGVIIYLSLADAVPQSTLTKASGNWVIPLNLARSSDLSSFASYDRDTSIEEIFVQSGPSGTASVVATTKYDSPLPTITLGRTFDFRKSPAEEVPTPQVPLSQGRFSFGNVNQPSIPGTNEITINNPQEGENINTQTPEILGTGPAGETLNITVNSLESLTGQVVIKSDGSWSWIPPSSLSLGQHTLTISLSDGRSITRSFTVLAAGVNDLPSFTSTPSGTLTPTVSITTTPGPSSTPTPTVSITATLTVTATPTATGRVSQPSTEGGVLKPGNLTPTFFISIMGIVLLSLGIVFNIVFKKVFND